MKITITGGTGFVGTNLKDFLNDDYQVDLLSVRFKENQTITIDCDIVIHLAGKAHDLKNVSKPNDYYEANFELTKQLFDAFLKSDASVFIFMSTVKAVTDKVNGVLTEDFIPNPITHYGKAKRQAEEYLLSHKLPEDKRMYILRPCMIHGPKNKGNLNLLYKIVSKGVPWPLGAFENQRSFLSIDNLSFVVKELIENDLIPTGIYNLSDDKALSTNELIKILGESLRKQNLIWNINPFLIRTLASVGGYIGLPLNIERLEKLTENYAVSNKKIVSSIGKPLPLSAEDGLIKTFKSFKE